MEEENKSRLYKTYEEEGARGMRQEGAARRRR